jgi:hypothetical protein
MAAYQSDVIDGAPKFNQPETLQNVVYQAVLFDLALDRVLGGSPDEQGVRELIDSLTALSGERARELSVDESVIESIIMLGVDGRGSLVEGLQVGYVRTLTITKVFKAQSDVEEVLFRAVGIAERMPYLPCAMPALNGRYLAADDDVHLAREYFRAKLLGRPFAFAMPLYQVGLSAAYVRLQALLLEAVLDEAVARAPIEDGQKHLPLAGLADAVDGEKYPVHSSDILAVLQQVVSGEPSASVPPRRISVIRDLLLPAASRDAGLTEQDVDGLLDQAAKDVNTITWQQAVYGRSER